MRHPYRKILYGLIALGWIAAVAVGVSRLWAYEGAAGVPAQPPSAWPADTAIFHDPHLPELVLLVHPQCPCSRATIGELARLMAQCDGKLIATVMVMRPAGVPEAWEHTDLWSSAAAIPGVTVKSDDEGRESHRFGAATSGQAILYAADGRLLFAGGITESRGHSGDNAGESAIVSLVLGDLRPAATIVAHTSVYGCGLFNDPKVSCPVCRQ